MAQLPNGRDTFLAIDANAIIHRAFHAFPETLNNSSGVQLNAVYGFTSMLLSVLSEFKPKYIVAAFDTSAPTFRHTRFPDYKAHRKPTEQTLVDQFPLVEQILDAFNIPVLKKEGFEADDILGDLSYKASEGKWKDYPLNMVIVSGDKDLLQLVCENVFVCLPVGNFKNLLLYDESETVEKIGVKPIQIIDYKSLVGDPSDNIPGVKGMGSKGTVDLLRKYGSVDLIYQNLNELSERQAKILLEGVEQMEMSRKLATIERDIDIELALERALFIDFDREEVLNLFNQFEFRSLVSKIPGQPQSENQSGQFGLFGGVGSQSEDSDASKTPSSSSFENDTSGTGEAGSGISEKYRFEDVSGSKFLEILSEKAEGERAYLYYLSDKSVAGNEYTLLSQVVDNSGAIRRLKGVLDCETIVKVVVGCTDWMGCETILFGWEDLMGRVIDEGVEFEIGESGRIFDIQLASHILSSGDRDKSFDSLVYKYLGVQLNKVTEVEDVISSFEYFVRLGDHLIDEFKKREITARSVERLSPIEKGKEKRTFQNIYYEYEISLSIVLAKMEKRGFRANTDALEKLRNDLEKEILQIQEKIFSDVGHEFNLNSPAQLGAVLFDELNLPQGRGKTGRSTREDILRKFEALHPMIPSVLEYRELSKLLGTYIKPMPDLLEEDATGVNAVHTNFLQTGSSSGRLSSQDPNMQNLPVKGGWSGRVRELFIARDGYKLLSMDYSQIELRILADLSQDPLLMKDFRQDRDIHTATASRILDKSLKNVSDKDRRLGKLINFGILYGQTRFGLSEMLGISIEDAQKYIDEYFENYAGVKEYISQMQIKASEDGFVETLMGRRRYIDGLDARNQNVRNAAIREAINMPIQGTAADIIKVAMVEIDRFIQEKYSEDLFLLLQIHDELIFEVKEELVDKLIKPLEDLFSRGVQLSVPIVVHSSIGSNLSEI